MLWYIVNSHFRLEGLCELLLMEVNHFLAERNMVHERLGLLIELIGKLVLELRAQQISQRFFLLVFLLIG